MELNVKPAAAEYLAGKLTPAAHLFLVLDDGSSKYSKLGGTCAIGNKFQLVASTQADTDYATPLPNNGELTLTTGDLEQDYLGNGLSLDYRNGALSLRDDSGLLDGAVTLTAAPQTVLTAAERQSLGDKIC